MVLYLENLCLTEKSRIFIPQPRQAPGRCSTFYKMNPIKLNIHGKQKLLPQILNWISIVGWISIVLLIAEQENQFKLVQVLEPICIFFFFVGMLTTIIGFSFGRFDTNLIWTITGEIMLQEDKISFDQIDYPLSSIKKIHIKAYNTKGVASGKGIIGDGANNELEITTDSKIQKRKFVIDSKSKREMIKDYCFKLKEQNIPIYIDGIDLK
jgi:hypothetical protein